MSRSFGPIHPKFPRMLHGGDYNPDQWPSDTWDDDIRLMKLSRCNTQTLAIFSWAHIETEEGRFTFDWLDTVMDKLAANGFHAILATPSASPPAWMSSKYPEILRVGADRIRRLHGNRVNNCWTSPLFRDKCREMASHLAERYRGHSSLLVWHLYNEFGGECHCDLCQNAFRGWLERKFGTLDRLNQAYWTAFWGHDYTDWSQIESPGGPYGESSIMGLTLDWRRFTTDQVLDFMRNEARVLRDITPDIPRTTNFMGTYSGLNYWKIVPDLDVVSWDAYPFYHDRPDDWKTAVGVSFTHDIYRTFKGGKPFMLMESTPSACNWWPAMKLKRPGIHRLTSLQAVAHGSDTVQYFQWRQSRGGGEKLHGAVVSHSGHVNTRVFREVTEIGELLERLDPIVGSTAVAEVAVLYDWENNWAIELCDGPRARGRDYGPTCIAQYRPYWSRGIPVDIPDMDGDLTRYRLVIAPMLYMLRPGVAERIGEFVKNGGTFVTTYWTGIVDENDLCFAGGFPEPLRSVLGIQSEELDVLYDDESNRVVTVAGNSLGLTGEFRAHTFCDLIHTEGAEVLAVYGDDFYAGRPAVTMNRYGAGSAFTIASRNEDGFTDAFHSILIDRLGLRRILADNLPTGVTVQERTDGVFDFLFVLNFTREEQSIDLSERDLVNMATGDPVASPLVLPPYGSIVLQRRSKHGA